MSKSDLFESDLLKLIFNAVPIANIADNAASIPLTQIWIALHTADPGEAGNQSTSEAAYSGNTRVGVARTAAGWVVTGNSVSPVASIDFPEAAGAGGTISYWSAGVASGGATKILYSGTVTPNIAIAAGVTPRLKSTSTVTED
jgi:hypothetical protein